MKIEKYDEELGSVSWEILFIDTTETQKDGIVRLNNEPDLREMSKLAKEKGYDVLEITKTTVDIERYNIKGDEDE